MKLIRTNDRKSIRLKDYAYPHQRNILLQYAYMIDNVYSAM